MKKTIAILLALVLVVGLFAGCGKKSAGSVYYLNFKPEADEAWQALAKTYTEKTGVKVTVVTAASGTYADTLTAELDKSEAPTMFQAGNQGAIDTFGDWCLDLRDTDVYKEMTTDAFNLKGADGAVLSIGYCYESYGIIVNKALLKQAGYELTDIKDFASLKAAADDIHARAAELGFDAFTSAGLDGSSSWRFSGHLINMPLFYQARDNGWTSQPSAITADYLDNFKAIWDLYTTDSATTGAALTTATGDQAEAEFGKGEAVFYQNGTWEYGNLTEKFGMNPADLAMIPIYCGVAGEEKAGLCSGTENCWAVNSQVSEADQKASLDFLYWLVTDEVAAQKMVDTLGALPFKAAPASSNTFLANGNDLLAKGNYNVSWAFNHTPNVDSWRATVVTALAAYSAAPSDATWADVVSAFVDGWAAEYAIVNG